jgi:hypothetical protein
MWFVTQMSEFHALLLDSCFHKTVLNLKYYISNMRDSSMLVRVNKTSDIEYQ